MARVGKSRVLGSSAVIQLTSPDGSTFVDIGEIDKFTAKQNTDLKKSRPLGKKVHASQLDHMGWDLTFEGGKVDWKLSGLFTAQERQFVGGGRSPYFSVLQSVKHYDGSIEQYRYHDVTLHGFNEDFNGSSDEVMDKFEGFAGYREVVADTVADTGTSDAANILTSILARMADQTPTGDGTLLSSANAKVSDSIKTDIV